jgi:hypothetical protein
VVTLNTRFVRTFRRTTPSAPVLALINASLQAFSDLLFSPYLLATLIFLLGGSSWKIGLPIAISGAAWAISVPVRSVLSRISPPGRYLATVSGVVRSGAAALIAWLGYFADDVEPKRMIDLLLMCFAVYAVASAFNLTTTRGLIAASTPAIRAGSLFAMQRFFGGAASVLAGVVAIYALRSHDLDFYKNIGVLYLLGAVGVAAATWFQFMTTVAATRAINPPTTGRTSLWQTVSNPAVRRLLGFRFLTCLATLADPFILMFGLKELGFDLFYIGVAITLYAAGQLAGALVGPNWVSHRGPRGILLGASVARLMAIVLALTIPPLSRTTAYTDRFDTNWQATLAFVALFALLGVSAYLQAVGSQRYIYDVVPVANRLSTISLGNLLLAVGAAAPLLGAYLIEQYDLETLLIVATSLAFVGFASGGLLFDPSPRAIRRQGAWRQRRTVRRTT